MFSLIITIIAIALVAALALATIYYGSTAFNRGSSSANAAKLMNQSQQILGADRLYRVDHEGAMPPSMQALVDGGYLRTIPVAQINGQFDAVAAGTAWTMVASPSGRAYTFSSGDVDEESCKAVNQMAFGQNGIPNKVFNGFKTQCYGPDATHLAIVVVADPEVLGTVGSTNTELPNSPTIASGAAPGASDWTSAPTDTSGSGGSGGSSGGTSGPFDTSVCQIPSGYTWVNDCYLEIYQEQSQLLNISSGSIPMTSAPTVVGMSIAGVSGTPSVVLLGPNSNGGYNFTIWVGDIFGNGQLSSNTLPAGGVVDGTVSVMTQNGLIVMGVRFHNEPIPSGPILPGLPG